MALCPGFVDFARDVARRGAGEIGMHLHAWNSPPLAPLTDDDMRNQPYLFEYDETVMRDKIGFMTDLLEDRFRQKMLSHRAGRWGFNAVYARLLVEHGYLVDSSVTPHICWGEYLGDPNGAGGPDFRQFPESPYYVDLEHVDRPGDSPLLEVPLSVVETRQMPLAACQPVRRRIGAWMPSSPKLMRRIAGRIFPPFLEMVPRDSKRSLRNMLAILRYAVEHRRPCVVMATHSSELMPGGSPFFRTAASIERALPAPGNRLFHGGRVVPRDDVERISREGGKGDRHLLPKRPDQPSVGARCFAQKVPVTFYIGKRRLAPFTSASNRPRPPRRRPVENL